MAYLFSSINEQQQLLNTNPQPVNANDHHLLLTHNTIFTLEPVNRNN